MTWQKCPVCDGGGTVPNGFYLSHYARTVGHTSTSAGDEPCKTCTGIGVIEE